MPQIGINAATPQEGYVFQKFTEAYNEAIGDWHRGPGKVKTINGLPVINTVSGLQETVNADEIIQELVAANKLTRL